MKIRIYVKGIISTLTHYSNEVRKINTESDFWKMSKVNSISKILTVKLMKKELEITPDIFVIRQ